MTDRNKAAVLALLHENAFCWIATNEPATPVQSLLLIELIRDSQAQRDAARLLAAMKPFTAPPTGTTPRAHCQGKACEFVKDATEHSNPYATLCKACGFKLPF